MTAVYLVSPTYYGVAADLASIERIVHGAGKLLLVDEAWGPHFHFHPALPLSATARRRRPLHQLDPQDAVGVLAVRDAAPKGRPRSARPAQGRAEDVPLDVAQPADGRLARRRAQADGDRGRGAALADDRVGARDAPRGSTRSTASTASARSCGAATGVFDLDPTKITVTVQGPRLHGLRGVGNPAPALQHPGRAGRSLQRRRALYDRDDARRRRPPRRRRSTRWRATIGRSTCTRRRESWSSACTAGTIHLPPMPPMRMLPRDAFLADTEFVKFQASRTGASARRRSRRIRRAFR